MGGMGHYQINFRKYNNANGNYRNKNNRHQRQSHFKERVRPKFVKTSRRGLKDDKYNDKPFPRDKKDSFHGKRKVFTDKEYHTNQPFQHHRHSLHNTDMQQSVMFNTNPTFHKLR